MGTRQTYRGSTENPVVFPAIPLRVCKDCGLEALIEADLKLFIKDKTCRYERINKCKQCYNKQARKYRKSDKLIETFKSKTQDEVVLCSFCKEQIVKLHGRYDGDALMIHSHDGNHNNWDPENKTPMHNKCHTKHHYPGRIQPKGNKSPSWKGEHATEKSKRSRIYREQNREKINKYKRQWRQKK